MMIDQNLVGTRNQLSQIMHQLDILDTQTETHHSSLINICLRVEAEFSAKINICHEMLMFVEQQIVTTRKRIDNSAIKQMTAANPSLMDITLVNKSLFSSLIFSLITLLFDFLSIQLSPSIRDDSFHAAITAFPCLSLLKQAQAVTRAGEEENKE
jgi:hypothetical protein